MHFQILIATVLFASAVARPEPPSPFLDEPLEGTKLEPELVSRVRDLLISDATGVAGGASPQSQSASSSSSSYSAPPSANSYGPPGKVGGGGGGFGNGMRGFSSSPPSGNFGGFGGSNPGSSVAEVMLSDPELAPLLDAFDLSPTVQKRTGSQSGGSQGGNRGFNGNNAGHGGSRFGNPGSGGY